MRSRRRHCLVVVIAAVTLVGGLEVLASQWPALAQTKLAQFRWGYFVTTHFWTLDRAEQGLWLMVLALTLVGLVIWTVVWGWIVDAFMVRWR